MSEDKFIVCQTEIGWIAAKIVEELEDKYIIEFDGGKRDEVLKEEIFIDEWDNMHVMWW